MDTFFPWQVPSTATPSFSFTIQCEWSLERLGLPAGNSSFSFSFRRFSHSFSDLLKRKTIQTETGSNTLGGRLVGKSNPSLLEAMASEELRGW